MAVRQPFFCFFFYLLQNLTNRLSGLTSTVLVMDKSKIKTVGVPALAAFLSRLQVKMHATCD